MQNSPKTPQLTPDRPRVNLELSPVILSLLDHVCEVTGHSRAQVINSALFDALPALLERVEGLQKRSLALTSTPNKKRP